MDEEDLRLRREEARDGQHAKLILDNPLWQRVYEEAERNLKRFMEEPSTLDEDVLEARRGLIALRRVKKNIETAMTTGDMAVLQIREHQSKEK